MLNRPELTPKRQKLRAMLVSAFSEHILLLQVVRYCLQKCKFHYFELTLNNLKAIFFFC